MALHITVTNDDDNAAPAAARGETTFVSFHDAPNISSHDLLAWDALVKIPAPAGDGLYVAHFHLTGNYQDPYDTSITAYAVASAAQWADYQGENPDNIYLDEASLILPAATAAAEMKIPASLVVPGDGFVVPVRADGHIGGIDSVRFVAIA